MSAFKLLAETDQKMIATLTLRDYFNIFFNQLQAKAVET